MKLLLGQRFFNLHTKKVYTLTVIKGVKVEVIDNLGATSKCHRQSLLNETSYVKLENGDYNVQVEWSYPSSENAAKFGYSKAGCWTVELSQRICFCAPIAVKAFEERALADEYAKSLPFPFPAVF